MTDGQHGNKPQPTRLSDIAPELRQQILNDPAVIDPLITSSPVETKQNLLRYSMTNRQFLGDTTQKGVLAGRLHHTLNRLAALADEHVYNVAFPQRQGTSDPHKIISYLEDTQKLGFESRSVSLRIAGKVAGITDIGERLHAIGEMLHSSAFKLLTPAEQKPFIDDVFKHAVPTDLHEDHLIDYGEWKKGTMGPYDREFLLALAEPHFQDQHKKQFGKLYSDSKSRNDFENAKNYRKNFVNAENTRYSAPTQVEVGTGSAARPGQAFYLKEIDTHLDRLEERLKGDIVEKNESDQETIKQLQMLRKSAAIREVYDNIRPRDRQNVR